MNAPTPRIVATFENYLGLVAALRSRLTELGISYSTLDELAGWTDTYATKLLGEEPIKHFGPMSLDAVLGALALKGALIEDEAALERVKRHRDFVPRQRPPRLAIASGKQAYIVQRKTREQMRQMAVLGGLARAQKLSPAKRKKIAKKAARTRYKLGRN